VTFVADAYGSVIALTGPDGTIQTDYSYGPSGAISISGASNSNPYQYAGMQDDEPNLYYGQEGYYNPSSGLNIGLQSVVGIPGVSGSLVNLSNPISPQEISGGTGACDECRFQLREHLLTDYLPLPVVHSAIEAWNTRSSGHVTIVEGEDSIPPDPPGYLVARKNTLSAPAFELVDDVGPSSELCSKVNQMVLLAVQINPQLRIPYDATSGPNCNTLAHFIDSTLELNLRPDWLMRVEGWYSPL
jgi:hypothetical protein